MKHYLTPPEWQYKTPEEVTQALEARSAIGNPEYNNQSFNHGNEKENRNESGFDDETIRENEY